MQWIYVGSTSDLRRFDNGKTIRRRTDCILHHTHSCSWAKECTSTSLVLGYYELVSIEILNIPMQSTRTYMFRPIACSLIRVAVTAKAGKAVLAVSWDVLHSKIDSVACIWTCTNMTSSNWNRTSARMADAVHTLRGAGGVPQILLLRAAASHQGTRGELNAAEVVGVTDCCRRVGFKVDSCA